MKTILAVDDTSINLDILLEYLKDYNLIITTSGYQALEILKENRVDLILLDIVMPNIDGFETCIKIKSNPLTKEIPIIFITAKKDEQSIEKAYDIGGVDYVTKPFMKKELLSRINTHLKLYEQNQFLMKKIEQETQKRVEQQKLFEKQSKLAAMGEMVDAIAHQWKQPLSIINILSSNLELKSNYMECVTKEIIEQTNNDIIEQVEHLTQTINEFRNFFKADIQLKNTNIKELISSVIKLNESMLVENEIEVIVNCKDDIFYNLNQNEFKHIFINIINNSKDEFLNISKDDKIIIFDVDMVDGKLLIKIIDNANGIPLDIIDKIFKANFTSKESLGGTGIGLYLSKQIVEKLNGTIEAKNLEYEYNGNSYYGACFEIKI